MRRHFIHCIWAPVVRFRIVRKVVPPQFSGDSDDDGRVGRLTNAVGELDQAKNWQGLYCTLSHFVRRYRIGGREFQEGGKIKKAEDFSSAFSRWYPPPGTLPKTNLLQGVLRVVAGAHGDSSAVVANHSIRERAEVADTGLVRSQRGCNHLIGGRRATSDTAESERITALVARRQLRVDQASASRSRRSASSACQRVQIAGKADRRIG